MHSWPDRSTRGGGDLILVGDSLGRAVLGYTHENEVTLGDMLHHARAVLRGAGATPVIVDLPAGSYDRPEEAGGAAAEVMSLGAAAVKIEGCLPDIISHLCKKMLPVVAHLGYTPQTANREGSKVVGKSLSVATKLFEDARTVEESGALALVLEMVPREVAGRIAACLKIPVIGIGSGPDLDGQVLVTTDMWGDNEVSFKFLRRFGEVGREKIAAVRNYVESVRSGSYPADENSFHMDKRDLGSWIGRGEREVSEDA
ncbi:MAG: 3-methyl-2-oxobutanoate hydroxymethyltransferase [Planctomycetes bacterium]|nr:3-methyl-2-oxobutanoate hydroxymethyltransferase [Planctomycetota bacterium]